MRYSKEELACKLWELYYSYHSRLYGKVAGKGSYLGECRHADKFHKAAAICMSFGMLPEDYVYDILEVAYHNGRTMNPSCLVNEECVKAIKPRGRRDYPSQWKYQVAALQELIDRRQRAFPDMDIDDILCGVLKMADSPFRPWFRVCALDAPFESVMHLYGDLAEADIQADYNLREFLEKEAPRALAIFDAWVEQGGDNVPGV